MKTTFVFYWEYAGKHGEAVAFYNTPMEGSMSTVTAETLEKMGVAIPETPTYEVWKQETTAHTRCGKCWDPTTPTEYAHHLQKQHFTLMAAV